MSVYENLGVKEVINAMGNNTPLGGSILAKNVRDAMNEANECFIELWELHEKASAVIADICGAEAGWVTPGAHAALVLSAAACIAVPISTPLSNWTLSPITAVGWIVDFI